MRQLPRALTEPWLISEPGRELVLGVWSRGELHQDVVTKALARATAGAEGEPLKYSRATKIENGIALIPVEGPLFRKAGLFSEISGATSYDQIRQDLRLALADGGVRGIMLVVNSPGGEANGCSELADEIFRARSQKLIWSYVSGLGQSAGCWLYSAAEHVICSDTALLGCIGVRQSVVDTSKSQETAGIKVHDIVNDESPAKRDLPIDDEVLEKVQRQVNALAKVFIAAMAQNRGVTEEGVVKKFGAGDSLVGQEAVDAGLADEIGNLDSAVASMRAELAKNGSTARGTQSMSAAITAALVAGPKGLKVVNQTENPMPKLNATAGDEPEKKKDDEDKKESKAGEEMKKCSECDGEGEKDGEKCKSCDGEGEMPVSKSKSKAEDGDGDEDDKKKAEGDEDKEGKTALARMAGLSAGAPLSQIAAVLESRTAPLQALAEARNQNSKLADRVEQLEKKSHAETADKFVSEAIAMGRSVEEKRGHLVSEFIKAEKAKAGSGPAALEPSLFEKHTFTAGKVYTDGKGKPIGKKDEPSAEGSDDVRLKFAARASEIATKEKINFQAATARVKTVDPDLYAAFAALPPR
jgi:ClpP class serine protease